MKKGTRLPKRDVILFVVKEVMQKYKKIDSQEEFTLLVNASLKRVDHKLTISPRRLRLLTLGIPNLRLTIETRKGKLRKKCPSCSKTLRKIYTKNLKGRKLLYKLVCSRCGYSGKEGKWIPRRYVFIRK
ncbi:MAG: hypothetical protein GTN38_01660 [Candidatus Aenigmarchaeota archaeon]|nr:hypothetical protein [Candidatus Aenigmarchaeota archaeon]NIQ17286.1 hypothetical protein [Candidatus Aenigmarchaeota archaeon]NIS73147.1 hypothetical protein [Candidatus Aenigmarchaeota archaeon]